MQQNILPSQKNMAEKNVKIVTFSGAYQTHWSPPMLCHNEHLPCGIIANDYDPPHNQKQISLSHRFVILRIFFICQ